MRYEGIQQEKGLFTFYKEQQAEEDEIHRMLKKRKKGKSKKQKNHIQKIKQEASLPPKKFRDIAMAQIGESKQMENCKRFLRNVISKQNSQSMLNQYNLPSSFRLKTDTSHKLHEREDIGNLLLQRKMQTHKLTISSLLKQRDAKNIKRAETDNSNNKIEPLQNKVQSLQNTIKKQQSSKNNSEFIISKAEKKFESRSFLEKLKHLEISNKSNLIMNRDSLYLHDRDKQTNDLHQQNKKYFHKLISNFYRQPEEKNQTGYKMIKETLRFPNIIKIDKIIRRKTQQQSPIQTKQKIMTPLKQFVSRKQIKRKSSNEKYNEQQVDWLKQSNQNEGVQLNLIDMSKDYSKQLIQSQERVKKKRLLRSRLGLEL